MAGHEAAHEAAHEALHEEPQASQTMSPITGSLFPPLNVGYQIVHSIHNEPKHLQSAMQESDCFAAVPGVFSVHLG